MREPIHEVMTVSEQLALAAIHEAVGDLRAVTISASDLADRNGLQRSSVSTALRLAQAAGVIRARSRGAAGTLVEVLRPEVLREIAEEASHYARLGAASG